FTTGWLGENQLASTPAALYGFVLLMAAVAYYLLQRAIICQQGRDSLLASAVGRDWKGKLSPALYFAAIPLAFVSPWIATTRYVFVPLLWLIPDRRIERALQESAELGEGSRPKVESARATASTWSAPSAMSSGYSSRRERAAATRTVPRAIPPNCTIRSAIRSTWEATDSFTSSKSSCNPIKCGPLTFQWACL